MTKCDFSHFAKQSPNKGVAEQIGLIRRSAQLVNHKRFCEKMSLWQICLSINKVKKERICDSLRVFSFSELIVTEMHKNKNEQ